MIRKAGRGWFLRRLRAGLRGSCLSAVGGVDCGFGASFLGRDHRTDWGVKGIAPWS